MKRQKVCLKFVSESQQFLSADVSDLQNFVNVALATAAGGEDALAYDRLSSLRTVCSGFSSLIYNLREDIGFQELCNRCSDVWTAYQNDENLLKMLVCVLLLVTMSKICNWD